jgi:hypothetical protein
MRIPNKAEPKILHQKTQEHERTINEWITKGEVNEEHNEDEA